MNRMLKEQREFEPDRGTRQTSGRPSHETEEQAHRGETPSSMKPRVPVDEGVGIDSAIVARNADDCILGKCEN